MTRPVLVKVGNLVFEVGMIQGLRLPAGPGDGGGPLAGGGPGAMLFLAGGRLGPVELTPGECGELLGFLREARWLAGSPGEDGAFLALR